jgi:hypothetical protein
MKEGVYVSMDGKLAVVEAGLNLWDSHLDVQIDEAEGLYLIPKHAEIFLSTWEYLGEIK